MKINRLVVMLFSLLAPLSSQAINVGDVTSIMPPGQASLAKEITNTTDTARFVSASVERISSPMASGVVIDMESKSELLSTPASLIMPGHAKEHFRFLYGGPKDDQERYYRISWTDESITEYDTRKNPKLGQATTSAIISTILVVAPRQEHFDFKHQADTITNTGNASFRAISYGPCRVKTKDLGQGCRERYYVMPGISVKIKHTDLSDKKNPHRHMAWRRIY